MIPFYDSNAIYGPNRLLAPMMAINPRPSSPVFPSAKSLEEDVHFITTKGIQ